MIPKTLNSLKLINIEIIVDIRRKINIPLRTFNIYQINFHYLGFFFIHECRISLGQVSEYLSVIILRYIHIKNI